MSEAIDTAYPQRITVSNEEEQRAVAELLRVLRGAERVNLLRVNWQVTLMRKGYAVESTVSFMGKAFADRDD